jgi:hypothetical protein
VYVFPSASPITHKPELGQLSAEAPPPRAAKLEENQVGLPLPGLVEVKTLPLVASAVRQSVFETQFIRSSPAGLFTAVEVQAPAAPVGVVVVNIFPEKLAAAQKEEVGQEIEAIDCVSRLTAADHVALGLVEL